LGCIVSVSNNSSVIHFDKVFRKWKRSEVRMYDRSVKLRGDGKVRVGDGENWEIEHGDTKAMGEEWATLKFFFVTPLQMSNSVFIPLHSRKILHDFIGCIKMDVSSSIRMTSEQGRPVTGVSGHTTP
jgi:hypothetical protein